jgi:hypothetical protein
LTRIGRGLDIGLVEEAGILGNAADVAYGHGSAVP